MQDRVHAAFAIGISDRKEHFFSLVETSYRFHFRVVLPACSFDTRWRRFTYRNGNGEKKDRLQRQASDDVDAALVKLVLAGGPRELLWIQPGTSDLDRALTLCALRQEIEEAGEEDGFGIANHDHVPGREPAICREFLRPWREWIRCWFGYFRETIE